MNEEELAKLDKRRELLFLEIAYHHYLIKMGLLETEKIIGWEYG